MAAPSPVQPQQLLLSACRTDSIPLITSAISLARTPSILSQAVHHSIRLAAPNVLRYVLAHGGQVPEYSDLYVETPGKEKEILEILLAYGWDINARRASGGGGAPFLWGVVGNGEMVSWCLEHGAALTTDEGCPPILESAATQSTVATFELLRSRGAPLGRRTLHFAARAAINSGNAINIEHAERLAMVQHLVDTLKLDPNALDQPTGWSLGNHWGTPLCYVARSNPNWDCSEVLLFLLQRGADPELVVQPAGWNAVELARRSGNERFLRVVEEWK